MRKHAGQWLHPVYANPHTHTDRHLLRAQHHGITRDVAIAERQYRDRDVRHSVRLSLRERFQRSFNSHAEQA